MFRQLLQHQELGESQMRTVMEAIIAGECGEAEAAAFLMGLRMKGETAAELAAAASVLRAHMVRWDPGCDVLDTCGTGGDGLGTFNISTAAALVVAGAGVAVVKHGNRSVSSRSGSADVLAALGVTVEGDAVRAQRCLQQAGLAFCFAPHFHPALKHIAAVRRKLGVPTIFNCLGPLANPAGATRQLLGVGRSDLLERMAGALALLGVSRALVVCGRDGLDEVTLATPTLVREIRGSSIMAQEWTAADFGLEPCSLAEIFVEGPQESARIIEGVLAGQEGPALRVVLANAAAALVLADRAADLPQGVALARHALASGKARQVLEKLRQIS